MKIKNQWLFIFIYILILVGMMVGLAFYLSQPTCRVSASCVWSGVLGTAVTLIVIALLLGAAFLRWLRQPIKQLGVLVQRIASGDTQARLMPQSPGLFSDLVRAFNEMRDRLVHQLDSLEKQQRQLALVLQHMADGVLIVNGQGYVQLINPAAANLLNTSADVAHLRAYAEVVRHHQLIELYQHCRETEENQVAAFEMSGGRFWQAVVSPFKELEVQGYLVILQDLTAIRHLETVRRDFISNLSHELRTPLAS
ncbi:MAG: HAMP domain-containing protein, partial [Anaerolineales bacterium]|nr:HAMP domain-containing protein [Anaerolineales bacterium]